jgi:capsular exopolysaccharide synthesis family protein
MDTLLRMTPGMNPDGHFDEIARAPMSPFTSSLQKVKACIKFANGDRPIRRLGITSALPREGKSTIASNLATLFSMSGSRILVIDADLYSSTLSKKLAPASTGGLLQALREPAIAKQQIISPKDAGFDLLPAVADPIVNSSDILASEYMQILLESLGESYDLIIFDLPPMKPMVDGLVISALLDGVILVVEWGQTPVELVAEIARSLHMAKASVLGIVMTKVDAGPAKPYYGYYNTYRV